MFCSPATASSIGPCDLQLHLVGAGAGPGRRHDDDGDVELRKQVDGQCEERGDAGGDDGQHDGHDRQWLVHGGVREPHHGSILPIDERARTCRLSDPIMRATRCSGTWYVKALVRASASNLRPWVHESNDRVSQIGWAQYRGKRVGSARSWAAHRTRVRTLATCEHVVVQALTWLRNEWVHLAAGPQRHCDERQARRM